MIVPWIFVLCGCVGPHYHDCQLVLWGEPAPPISGSQDPKIAKRLCDKPNPPISLLAVWTGFATTPAKALGLQGWKDYHLDATASGAIEQQGFSSDRFLTVDVRLDRLYVEGREVPLESTPNGKYVRLEIFLGKVDIDRRPFQKPGATVTAKGKLVWDSDGWFEIHPQNAADVQVEN